MKKFRFSLEAVLRWKRMQEEEALKNLGAHMRRRQQAHETLMQSRRELDKLLENIKEARSGRVEGWMQTAFMREMGRMEGLCVNYAELLQKAIGEENVAREAYLLKKRETQTIEKLREKRSESYIKEISVKTEKELEEIMLSQR